MKKYISTSLLLISIIMTANCQELNQTILSERTNSLILIGHGNRDAFAIPEFQGWFDETYETYLPEKDVMNVLTGIELKKVTITIVMATWCPDSRREVPGFYRILDELSFPEEAISLINVNTNKELPGEDLSNFDFEFVPTFIIYREGEELGRIIESPESSLEGDLLRILID